MSRSLKMMVLVLIAMIAVFCLSHDVQAGGCRSVGQIGFSVGGGYGGGVQTFAPVQQFQQSYSFQQQQFAPAPVYTMQQFTAPVGYGYGVMNNVGFAPVGYGGGAGFNVGFNFGRQRFFGPRFGRGPFRGRGRF